MGDRCSRRNLNAQTPQLVHEFSESVLKPAKPPDFQANTWEALNPTGSIPSARSHHTAVWSDMADGFFIFGGEDSVSGCLSGADLEIAVSQ